MKILKFHIVGLTHNDVKNCEVQYAKEAVGKTLCLVPDAWLATARKKTVKPGFISK